MISIVLPAYNEETMVGKAAERIGQVLVDAEIDYELVFVDDGSKDRTWEYIEALSEANDTVKGVHFSRNFGKEAAIFAGLETAIGDAVVVMDVDLQHPAETIPEMVKLWQEGYEVVEGKKSSRGEEAKSYGLISNIFYLIMCKATGFDMKNASDFKLLDRKVVDTLNSLEEKAVFFRALSFWSGYKKTEVEYEVAARESGETKWNKKKLISYALDNITSFTSSPLFIIAILGIVAFVVSFVLGIITIVQKISGSAVEGFTTVILLILLIGSLIMISLGVIGLYISKIYEEVKGRPRYIISKTCGGR